MKDVIYGAFTDELDKIAKKAKSLRGIPLSVLASTGGLGAVKSLASKPLLEGPVRDTKIIKKLNKPKPESYSK